jgi:hypothetical protein
MFATLIPSVPLYLVTLLHSIEGAREGEFRESALGFYYQYLLTEAFAKAGVDADKLTEVFEYASHLAWKFHSRGKAHLSNGELRGFNEKFSTRWHTVEYERRIDVLIKARVLKKSGGDYSFRYPYIYYFLKGRYLSEFLSDPAVREYIKHCCEHLYVRDNANTVLFLAHHTNDVFVIDAILTALRQLFSHRSAVTFEGDTDAIEQIIEDAPRIAYSGESPAKFRQRQEELKDALDDGGDGLVEAEEEGDELSLAAQLTTLFKTTEILGQVLKNQYSKIERIRRQDLLGELLQAPLRAVRNFYDYVERDPDAFAAELETILVKKAKITDAEERKVAARKAAAGIMQFVTFALLLKAVRSANSESLYEDITATVKKSGTMAFRLMELGVQLDTPQDIPKALLEELHRDAHGKLLPSRMINLMILHRLYMFKTSEQDMQWLGDKMDIDIGMQHKIAYQRGRGRRLR